MFEKSVFSQALVKLSLAVLNDTFNNIYFEPHFMAKPQTLSVNAPHCT